MILVRITRWRREHSLERAAVLILGACLFGSAITNLQDHRWFYTNYLSLAMLTPFALVVGVLLIIIAVVWPFS